MPFCHLTLRAPKPPPRFYPKSLNTIGNYIRKIRLDRGLWQRQVAAEIGVDTMTINNLETQRTTPSLRFMPPIIRFLDYDPFPAEPTQPLSAQLKGCRKRLGLSQERLARLLEVDESTVGKK